MPMSIHPDANMITLHNCYQTLISKIKLIANAKTIDCAYELLEKDNPLANSSDLQQLVDIDYILLATISGIISSEESTCLSKCYTLLTSPKLMQSVAHDDHICEYNKLYSYLNDMHNKELTFSNKFQKIVNMLKDGQITSRKAVALKQEPQATIKYIACSIIHDYCYNLKANNFIAEENLCVIIPQLWGELSYIDKLKIGRAYNYAYNAGMTKKAKILKSILLHVDGMSYIPECSTDILNSILVQNLVDIDDYIAKGFDYNYFYLKLESLHKNNCRDWTFISALLSILCSNNTSAIRRMKCLSSKEFFHIDNELLSAYFEEVVPKYPKILLKIFNSTYINYISRRLLKASSANNSIASWWASTYPSDNPKEYFRNNVLKKYKEIFER